MRPLVIVVIKPLVEVLLQFLHAGVELLPEGLAEELVQERAVEALHEAVGPGRAHLAEPVLDVVEL